MTPSPVVLLHLVRGRAVARAWDWRRCLRGYDLCGTFWLGRTPIASRGCGGRVVANLQPASQPARPGRGSLAVAACACQALLARSLWAVITHEVSLSLSAYHHILSIHHHHHHLPQPPSPSPPSTRQLTTSPTPSCGTAPPSLAQPTLVSQHPPRLSFRSSSPPGHRSITPHPPVQPPRKARGCTR